MAAIVAEGITKVYSNGVRALDGVDLEVPAGQIFGYLGQNGSGKSTSVQILTTLIRPTSGKAWVDGLDVQRQPDAVRARIGVALQEAGLDNLQTGRELLRLQARLYGVPGRHIAQRVSHLFRIIDLEDAAERAIRTYSGGMRRRLDLASALVHSPKIVFLDEPTTGLDPISRETLWSYLEELNRDEGVTFFLTTQYLEEADRLADRIAILEAGRIVTLGSPAELKSAIATDVVTVKVNGDAEVITRAVSAARTLAGVEDVRTADASLAIYIHEGSTAITRIVRLMDEVSVPVGGLTLSRPTLEDVFLRATGHHLQVEEPPAAGTAEGS